MGRNYSQEVACIAEFQAKSEMREKLLEALLILIPLTRAEPGCLRYELHQQVDNPNVITFIERFKNKEAFDIHCNMDYIKNFFAEKLPGLVSCEPKITLHYEIIS